MRSATKDQLIYYREISLRKITKSHLPFWKITVCIVVSFSTKNLHFFWNFWQKNGRAFVPPRRMLLSNPTNPFTVVKYRLENNEIALTILKDYGVYCRLLQHKKKSAIYVRIFDKKSAIFDKKWTCFFPRLLVCDEPTAGWLASYESYLFLSFVPRHLPIGGSIARRWRCCHKMSTFVVSK